MAASDQFIDTMPERGYDEVLAPAYDAWLPPGTVFADDRVHLGVIRRAGGTALELGTGNGRFLVPARQQGLDVEGLESSPHMLARCRTHLASAGVDAVLHEGTMAPLALGRRYAAIVCPAGSFLLVVDSPLTALRSYREHLAPGGVLALSGSGDTPGSTTGFQWRLRRTGTDRASGLTYVTHEAVGVDDTAPQVHLVFNRLEVYDAAGGLQDTWFRRMRLRWWPAAEILVALRAAGFANVQVHGGDDGWVALATA